MTTHPITVERHEGDLSVIGYRNQFGAFIMHARLATFHHEAAGWADALASFGHDPVVFRPAGYDGCPCNRCKQGWTQQQGSERDRELPGDRLTTRAAERAIGPRMARAMGDENR